MAIELDPKLVMEESGLMDACPECGHVWPEGIVEHEHDCRYYPSLAEEDDDDGPCLFSDGTGSEHPYHVIEW